MTVGAGLVERAADGALYNTYLVALPNGKHHRHRKIHCFMGGAVLYDVDQRNPGRRGRGSSVATRDLGDASDPACGTGRQE